MTPHLSRIAGICLLIATFAGSAAAAAPVCEPQKVGEKYPGLAGRTIHLGADPQTAPYTMRSPTDFNQFIGNDPELAKAVFDCIGVKYEIAAAAWSGLLPAVISGQIDMMFYLYYNPTRAKQVNFVDYMKAGTGALAQAGNPKNLHGYDDLCGATVAVGLGSVEEAQMRTLDGKCRAASHPGVEVMTYADHAAGIRLVQAQRADIMLTDLALVDSVVKEQPAVFQRAFGIVSGMQIGVAIAKNNDELLQAVYDALLAVQASGQQHAILTHYAIDPSLELPAEIKKE